MSDSVRSDQPVATLPGRVIQIQAVMHPGDYNCGPHTQLFALLDTGDIYIRYESSGSSNVPTDGLWRSILV